jgi:hypothetical protein
MSTSRARLCFVLEQHYIFDRISIILLTFSLQLHPLEPHKTGA